MQTFLACTEMSPQLLHVAAPWSFPGRSATAVGLPWMMFADNAPVKTGIIRFNDLRFEQAAANYLAANRDRNRIEITYPDILIPIRAI